MDAEWILSFVSGYVAAAVTVFLLYSPFFILFLVLLLIAGILRLLGLALLVLFRRHRGRGKIDSLSDGSWLLH
jgi:apolipoprotein N-acyltransferase